MTLPFLYALLLFFVLPFMAWSSGRRIRPGMVIPRLPLYAEVAIIQIILISFSLVVARRESIALFATYFPSLRDAMLAAALLAISLIALTISARNGGLQENLMLRLVAPQNGLERLLWIPVSLLAGIGEELAYRGVLPQLLISRRLPLAAVVVLCCVAFGLAHMLQGTTAVVITAFFGLGFHLLVLFTGSLYGAIAVHFLYDLIAGYLIARWIRREGELI